MNPVLQRVLGSTDNQGAYNDLPQFLKDAYTPRQWQFLSDSEKAGLVREQTEPDY